MSAIQLRGINKYYGRNHILKDLNLTIEDGDFMTLLGPSGCGKTTTLRVISGLEDPQTGTITVGGRIVADGDNGIFLPPVKRGLDLVFQSYALWPHMTVFDNVAFGLTLKRAPKAEIQNKVQNALKRMHIEDLSKRYPNELSGGQQQRVAIARAIVSNTPILLLDEPLSNLDAKLRVQMRSELKRLHKELGTTVVYVTHDQVEALTMSTKVAVFFNGVLAQCDRPMEVYRNPRDIQVADFIGNPQINMIVGELADCGGELAVRSPLGLIRFRHIAERSSLAKTDKSAFVQGRKVILAVRPEHIALSAAAPGFKDIQLEAAVYSVLPAGSETLVQLQAGGSLITAKCGGEETPAQDEAVNVFISTEHINIYDQETGKLLLGVLA